MNTTEVEQEIMRCWCITDDLEVIAEVADEDIGKMLRGLSSLYELKFQKLFKAFEDMLSAQRNE